MALGPQFDGTKKMLFADQFERMHGMTVDQALQGYSRPISGGELYDPEQMEDFVEQMPVLRKSGPWHEQVQRVTSTRRPIGDVVKTWMMDHTGMLVGGSTAVARDVVHFNEEMRNNARTPETRIYRGARMSPEEQARTRPDIPMSFTEDRHVATSFAKAGNARGSIFKAEPGRARGLFVPDYVDRQRTVGQNRRPEREWLIDPQSLIEES